MPSLLLLAVAGGGVLIVVSDNKTSAVSMSEAARGAMHEEISEGARDLRCDPGGEAGDLHVLVAAA